MIDINTALFLAKDRQRTLLTRAAQARLAQEARAGRKSGVTPRWHVPHLSVRAYVRAILRGHTGSAQQPCVTCG
jgi:hypothetical protein